MNAGARVVAVLLLVTGAPTTVAAQSAADRFAAGVRAYDELHFGDAVAALRLALSAEGDTALLGAARRDALAYLGAAEWFSGRRDSAGAVFQRLLIDDPRYELDTLRFPPPLTTAFAETRRTTFVVHVAMRDGQVLTPGTSATLVTLVPVTPHQVRVTLQPSGGPPAELYQGWLLDSLAVPWDGQIAGRAAVSGRYDLVVTSFDSAGTRQQQSRTPLQVTSTADDTLPEPPPPPDHVDAAAVPAGPVLWGVLTGAAVLVAPHWISQPHTPEPGRIVVAGAIGLATIAAVLRPRHPDLPALRQAAERRWSDSVDVIHRENGRRRAHATVTVRAATGTRLP